MIISRTPLRMSFVGGGSDLPAYYRKYGGAVISATINKYVFVMINRKFDSAIRVSYSMTEEVSDIASLKHPIVKGALAMLGIKGGIEITTIADIPSSGTGLGSSSSFTAGLLLALRAYKNQFVDPGSLARESCHVEIDICGSPIGKQDQYAAAFGGFNLIRFHEDDSVDISPVLCSKATLARLRDNLLLLYTGRCRPANTILATQSRQCSETPATRDALGKMTDQTTKFAKALQNDDCDAIGEMLHEGWLLKKSLVNGISTPEIDGWYETARRRGAIGGKILGAGGGGFLLLYAPPTRHEEIINALPDLLPVDFDFEKSGSRIIFFHP